MTPALAMFLFFVLITLGITWWAARRSRSAAAFFTASRRITGWQNGVAVAGVYMSAASYLGSAGLIAFGGYDGFMRADEHTSELESQLHLVGRLLLERKNAYPAPA